MGTRCSLAAPLAGLLSAAILAASLDAQAMGAVVTAPTGASAQTEVRVAVSSIGTRTSRWASIRVHGDATTFAWVMPVRSDAFVDLASDAWLEALAQATAPRVVPPDPSPPCGPGGVEVEDDLSHVATLTPDAVALVPDAATLASTLGGWGMDLPADLAALAATDGAGGGSDGGGGTSRAALLVLRYTNAPADAVTRTVRVVDSSPSVVPLAWTASGAGAIDVTAYAFARGFADVGSLAVVLDPNMLVWRDDGTSTYGAARDTLLASYPGAWLFETAGHAPLFDGQASEPGQLPVLTVPALAPTYYSLAAEYGDASDDATSCTASATAVSSSTAPVSLACPAGALARGGDASCNETESQNEDAGAGPASGTLAPATFRCGGIADDLALALSGLAPGDAWVTRARSVVPAGNYGVDAPVAADTAATAVGPVVACAGYEDACGGSSSGAPPTGGGTAGGGNGGNGTGNGNGNGGNGSGDGSDNGGGGAGADIGSAVGTAAGAAIDSSDGCGGDSSDSSGDSCDGSGGDGAGSDDSSGGGDCSGSTDSSGGDCSAAPRGRPGRHSPASRLLLVLAAVAAVARRGRRHPA